MNHNNFTLNNNSKYQYPILANRSNGDAKYLIVMLHGLGSDGYDLISLAEYLQNNIEDGYFIAPHGVSRYDMAPYGYQWFSVQDRTPELVMGLAKEASIGINEIIKNKQQELSIDNSRTILMGFSQGAMMCCYLTFQEAENPYLGTICFSGRLLPSEKINNYKTPFCIIHGADDDIIDSKEADNMESFLNEHNIHNKKLIIDNLKHSIDIKALNFAGDFMRELLYSKNS